MNKKNVFMISDKSNLLIRNPLLLRGGATDSILPFSTHDFFEVSADFINATGGFFLVVSCAVTIIEIVNLVLHRGRETNQIFNKGKSSVDAIRLSLGQMITFALELLVAADVIDTLTKPAHAFKMEALYKIALVVVIRTTLAFFLGKVMQYQSTS
jgi:uncharacterized membrane protein